MAQPLEGLIRSLPDYPKEGIIFRDITTLLQSPSGFRQAVDEMVQPFAGGGIGCVAGIEARGFILGGAVAHQLSVGFVAIGKRANCPGKPYRSSMTLSTAAMKSRSIPTVLNRARRC